MTNTKTRADACWTTASDGGSAETSPMELSALGEHLTVCRTGRGRMFALRCGADGLQGFVASRFVTTLAAVAMLAGALLMVI
ncbi:hypothetical protein C7444_114126 [Sphaerotilus hippei]|uniref:Uncharacterized protein n=1 Tax=Sphaerotilus hippei TaxID=744406 RepID=A0A318H5I0_9BURK|nr:hypothetical protein [Sphaerotilus hippei]PXW94427.1 hypothetical protein C7444_114126 [Sphaerotilus hippei]